MGKWIEEIAQGCRDYSVEYNCSLSDAVDDWEGDGPNGGWGLDSDADAMVRSELGIGDKIPLDYGTTAKMLPGIVTEYLRNPTPLALILINMSYGEQVVLDEIRRQS